MDVEPEVEDDEDEEEAEPPEENNATAPPQRAELPVKLAFLKVACWKIPFFQHRVRAGVGAVLTDRAGRSKHKHEGDADKKKCPNL